MIRMEIKKLIREAIKSVYQIDLELEEIRVDYPSEAFGDYSTNAAMTIAKIAKSNPMEVAEKLRSCIAPSPPPLRGTSPRAGLPPLHPASRRGTSPRAGLPPLHPASRRGTSPRAGEEVLEFEKIDVVKPGFINFYLSKDALRTEVKKISEQDKNYGGLDIGKGKKIQVEFISANPTGPLTLGNGRGGFYGDVLANILERAGFEVEREYYVNDVGEQIKQLGHSVIDDEQAVYKGEYIGKAKKSLPTSLLQREGDNTEEIGEEAAKIILNEIIRPTIEDKLKIKFDNWFSEASLYEKGEVDKALGFLKEKKLAYEKEGALWFKSTEFGDDKDRVLIKADNEKTYLASDIAYLKNKFERGFDKLIHIWGADHHGYIGRLKAAALALGYNPADVQIIIMQLVRLMSGGKEVRMSKRGGTYVTLEKLIDEVGLDATRFFFLMYSPDTHMNFDMDLAKEKNEKNPVYYVQYAHARICSIFNKYNANDAKFDANDANLNLLEHDSELKLIKQLIRFPEVVEDVANDYQVHRLPHYALDLVRQFHKFYEDCRVLAPSTAEGIDEKAPELTQARLALVKATQIVLKNTLDLMGIGAPEKM